MSIPRKHHYIPVFYLKQWRGPDRRLCEYKRVAGKIVTRRTFPDGTGYERDLYRIEGLPEALAHEVESKFMHFVDKEANYALQKIIAGDPTPWDARMRSAWVRFILSLRFRNPEAVQVIKQQMLDIWKAGVDFLRNNYSRLRRATDPPTFDEYIARTDREGPHKAALRFLQEIIDNQRVGPTIFDMHWSRVALGRSTIPLLTSDRPLDIHSLAEKNAYIVLPISPSGLFVAGHDDAWAKQLSTADPTEVVKRINLTIVSQARKLVWGVDDQQIRFVRNRLSSSPDRPIITDEQKQQAIAAAAERHNIGA